MISLVRIDVKKKYGYFRSYRDIGEFLDCNGETGKYYVIPKNIKSIAGIKEINVKKYWNEYDKKWDREIEMEGSYY
ncbi:MAG: hypothetical protein H8D39_05820 [Candidatus Atribacteria bacterium]|nr:hypothetical protein [Candidatus Atribacteria bacterium]MBC8500025.1 hypothetical protein [Candidatus Atribacteria bacterium]